MICIFERQTRKNIMAFFGLFGKSTSEDTNKIDLNWQILTEVSQIASIIETSKVKPVVIFKHSTTCGISRMVLRNFENSLNIEDNKIDLYYLDLKAFRAVSNEIAIQFQVLHQSPQLLIIKNGIAVYHASHHSIVASEIEKYL